MKQRQFAVFDIDGTLFRWQLFHELVEELTVMKVFPGEAFHQLNNAWQQWRGGQMPYKQYESLVMNTLLTRLPNLSTKAYDEACHKVIARSGHKVHYFTHALLQDLQEQGYVTIAISGSQQELLELFTQQYGFDISIGVIYERTAETFTGNLVRATYNKKGDLLKEVIADHNLSLLGSYGIGDSEGDIDMLAQVENPIAFNPSEGLFNQARQKGWNVVIERKNIVYKLEFHNGSYLLAEARPY